MKAGGFVDRVRQRGYEARYDEAETAAAEREKFHRLGFDYDRAVVRLDDVLTGLGKPPFMAQEGTASVHWVLFACAAQRFEVRRILEIGTFDGETTRLLSLLFPAAQIVTLELPDDDPIFAGTYQREDPANRHAFVQRLAENTAGPNIELIKANSIFLPSLGLEAFDLIWVDGSHLYPEVAWEISATPTSSAARAAF